MHGLTIVLIFPYIVNGRPAESCWQAYWLVPQLIVCRSAPVGNLHQFVGVANQLCHRCGWVLSPVGTHIFTHRFIQTFDEQHHDTHFSYTVPHQSFLTYCLFAYHATDTPSLTCMIWILTIPDENFITFIRSQRIIAYFNKQQLPLIEQSCCTDLLWR